jgi:hypothetical protein
MPWKGRYAYRLPLPDLVNAGHQLLAVRPFAIHEVIEGIELMGWVLKGESFSGRRLKQPDPFLGSMGHKSSLALI